MTKDEIKHNAPKGATHYKLAGNHVAYFKLNKHGLPMNYNSMFKLWIDSSTWIYKTTPL